MSDQFDSCIARQSKISALFLIDESLSLRNNDPNDVRVPALKAALIALNSLTRGESSLAMDVKVSIAGFGRGFHLHSDWTALNDQSLGSLLTEIDQQIVRYRDNLTQYDVALQDSIKQFEKTDEDGESCRLLIWFSDGQHESDTTPGYSSKEIQEITEGICGDGGIADALRTAGVHLEARGLNQVDPNRLNLMGLIAQQSGFVFEFGGTSLSDCGEREGAGNFDVASDPAEFFDLFVGLPGTPNNEVDITDCADGTPNCSELTFIADESVSNFNIRVTRPPAGIESATIQHGESKLAISLFEGSVSTDSPVEITRLTGEKVLIDASSELAPIAGSWTLRFEGPSADQVESLVRFVGVASVSLEKEDGSTFETFDRYGAAPAYLDVDSADANSVLETLEISLVGSSGELQLNPEFDGDRFKLASSQIQSSLQTESFGSSSAVGVSARPIGFVNGLVDKSGAPIEIEYKEYLFEVLISNGAQFPQWLSAVEGSELPKVKGTEELELNLRFRGPDGGTGYVEFIGLENGESKSEFEFIGSPGRCEIAAQTEIDCTASIRPTESGYGQKTVPIRVEYTSVTGEKQDAVIEARIVLTRDPSISKGVLAALEWLGLFVLVQILIRYGFALLLSRFSALEATARRVRIPVTVDADGAVTAPGGRFIADVSDGAFAFEVAEPQRRFEMLGYEFSSSVWETFKGSTTTPLGKVSQYGTFVFGSRGVNKPRKRIAELGTHGLIDLSLRSQWILAISNSELNRLANGETFVNAEVVAFLDPFELVELSGQLSDLEFSVTGSSVSADVRSVLDQLKVVKEVEVDDVFAVPDSTDPFSDAEQSGDPFGFQPISGEASDQSESGGRTKRSKKKKKTLDVEVDQQPIINEPFDPFA
jgi:hypothetical protein